MNFLARALTRFLEKNSYKYFYIERKNIYLSYNLLHLNRMKKIILLHLVVGCILLGCLASCTKPQKKQSDLVYNLHSKSLTLQDTSYFISVLYVLDNGKKDTAFVEFEDKLTHVHLKTLPNYRTKDASGNFDQLLTSTKLDFVVLLEPKDTKKGRKFFKFRTINPDSVGNIYAREW